MTEYQFLRQNGRPPARKAPAVFYIEGEHVGYAEIAKRLGLTPACAQTRMLKLRGASGAITWERLKAIGA
jgi:hypothetical protein